MKRPRTRQATLYRLVPEVGGTREEMFDAYDKYISARELDEVGAEVQFIDVAGESAIWIGLQDDTEVARWCAEASMTTGWSCPTSTAVQVPKSAHNRWCRAGTRCHGERRQRTDAAMPCLRRCGAQASARMTRAFPCA
jgi:hypothetical protein